MDNEQQIIVVKPLPAIAAIYCVVVLLIFEPLVVPSDIMAVDDP